MVKTEGGRFFEDFRLGEVIRHATPRTVSAGDVALYTASFGARFAVQSADTFARAIGYPRSPLDDFLVFHIVFGKTVPDISLNAVANLGYAACRVPGAGLSRRHADGGFRSHRTEARIPTGRRASSMSARRASTSRARRCSTISAG